MRQICPNKARTELTADGALLWRAPAKINLTLRIIGNRGDGYHEIDSVVAKITLYDELVFRRRGDGEVNLTCTGLDCGPTGENLVLRAVETLAVLAAESRAAAGGADIELVKRIPPGSGLGGGSSDAAATLQALDRLWELGLADERLADLGARIGSDVPLFLAGPAVRVRGRGERVEPASVQSFGAVLYLPDVHCPTAEVYAEYDGLRRESHPADHDPRLEEVPSRWPGQPFNDLEPAAIRVRPSLAEISRRLADATNLPVRLTGSGSAMFIVCDSPEDAQSAVQSLPADMKSHCRVVSLNGW